MKEIELAKELLNIPSETGDEENISRFIAERLRKRFEVKRQLVAGRHNIIAIKGKPKLILQTHIDTVPKQLPLLEDDTYLYGRGACDTKGIQAAMITAGEEAAEQGLENFGIVLTVGEEKDFAGIKEVVKIIKPEYVVVGEPTDLQIVGNQKGMLEINIVEKGKSAHSATPEKGDNAIDKLLNTIGKIKKIKLPESAMGKTTINIGKIQGGIAGNIVPDHAEATITFRTTIDNDILVKQIRDITKNIVVQSTERVEQKIIPEEWGLKGEVKTAPYFTEMPFWNCKRIIYGPGNIEDAHSDHEKIIKKDINTAKETYLRIIKHITRK